MIRNKIMKLLKHENKQTNKPYHLHLMVYVLASWPSYLVNEIKNNALALILMTVLGINI